jgi:hypothetical protein
MILASRPRSGLRILSNRFLKNCQIGVSPNSCSTESRSIPLYREKISLACSDFSKLDLKILPPIAEAEQLSRPFPPLPSSLLQKEVEAIYERMKIKVGIIFTYLL